MHRVNFPERHRSFLNGKTGSGFTIHCLPCSAALLFRSGTADMFFPHLNRVLLAVQHLNFVLRSQIGPMDPDKPFTQLLFQLVQIAYEIQTAVLCVEICVVGLGGVSKNRISAGTAAAPAPIG